jgi:hypothetical protein
VIDAEAFFYYNPGNVQNLRSLDQENKTTIEKQRVDCFSSDDHFDSHLHSHYDSEDYLQYGMKKKPRKLGIDVLSSRKTSLCEI